MAIKWMNQAHVGKSWIAQRRLRTVRKIAGK
jgi:hypothetical protein